MISGGTCRSAITATETMSKYRHRLTECLFPSTDAFHFGFLGETCQRLQGTLADHHPVLAVPDSGAERNVMDLRYAMDKGFDIKSGPKHRNYLQFADRSFEETVGQVFTSWTFESGERIPITFEVLEDCCSDVIIGEEILYSHDSFQKHASSLVTLASHSDAYELAPFDFITSWQRKCNKLIQNITPKKRNGNTLPQILPRKALY